MDFDVPWEYMEEFYEYCEDMGVSVYMLSHMVKINMYNKEKVCDGLVRLYMEKKGAMSTQAQYFLKLKEECEGK
jgi:predicted peroxiredoxin